MDAAQASSVPDSGTLVGERYRIGRVLGEGGMGVVLAATDESTRGGEEVALKLLQAVGQANVERFLREARLASRIESDHVVRIFDMGQHDGHPFIVMERLRGRDFGAKLRTFRLTLTEVADCIVQTCEALAHAHGEGIVHRDIKASNLFEAQRERGDGQPILKVLDFGISRTSWLDDSPQEHTVTKTQEAGLLGSPPYMSPEHIRNPRQLDGRADLWSLGVVAFRLLTTRFPFDGASSAEILVSILGRQPPTLREAGADVPQEIEDIVARCLARSRDDRFQHAGELAAAIAPFASPRWHSYGSSVSEIVASARVPPPRPGDGPESRVEPSVSRAKAPAREPTTRTVAPPVGAAIPPRSPELEVDRGLEFAPTAILTSGGAPPLAVTVVQAGPSDSDLVATTAATMPTAEYYDAGPTPPGVYRPEGKATPRRARTVPANRLLALAVFTLFTVIMGVRAFSVRGGPEVAEATRASRARAPVPVPVPSLQPPAAVTAQVTAALPAPIPTPAPAPAPAPTPAAAATSAVALGATREREPMPPPRPSRLRPPRHTWTASPPSSPAPSPPPATPRSELQPNPYAKTP